MHEAIKSTELEKSLQVIGSDGTAVLTGHSGGVICILEERLGNGAWSICLLDCNELPLRHDFRLLDGAATGPDSFSGKIGKIIAWGCFKLGC